MSNNLNQMNISYLPNEDRLLLKVSSANNSEYRLWLTRRFTILLLKVLDDQMQKQGGASEISKKKETLQSLKKGAFDKQYQPTKDSSLPLGEIGVLAFKINVSTAKNGQLNIQILPEEGEGVMFTLNDSMLYMFHSLLIQGISISAWNLQEQVPSQMELH